MKSKLLKSLFTPLLAFSALAFSAVAIKTPEKEEVVSAWSGEQKCSASASYYSSCDNLYGEFLVEALSKFNRPTNPNYSWSRYEAADEAEGDSSSIISIYTRHTIKKSSHCGDYAWDKWNREHVYTQTKFPNSDADNHNIFACEGQINQVRSNDKFAQLDKVKTTVSVFGHDTKCKSSGGYFEPCDDAKGEIARACMYCTVYYGYKLTDIFIDTATCLKWHAEHPVTNREIFRNNKVHTLQGNRNPFVDHPSYANKIFEGYTQYKSPDPIDGSTYGGGTKVTGVSFEEDTRYVAKGESITLTPVFAPADAANKNYEILVSNYTIISVSDKTPTSFKVNGLKEGTAKVTVVTSDGNFEAECTIVVNQDGQAPRGQPTIGCGGSVVASSVIISLTSIVGFTLLRFKKRKE